MTNTNKIPSIQILNQIKAVIFDFDGVFTDNRVIISTTGEEFVICDRGDGMGTNLLAAAGMKMLILSKEKNAVVTSRGKKLNIEVIQGCDDKLPELIQWLQKNSIDAKQAAYIGNDINDLECLSHVGVGAIPADAHHSVVAAATWILQHNGGRGAIREFADVLLDGR
jgi:YrbI family 3-deoxy-D-manno-octulosonate 8-phosphate phosphatase